MSYVGANIGRDDSWVLELSSIPDELRDEEAALMQTRWFDYRHMLPAQATYLFAHRYDAMYREIHSKVRDYRESPHVMTLLSKDVFKGDELIAIWTARQAADRIGCKYDFYLRFAFKRYWDLGWKRIARPNQMYSEELSLDIADSWKEETRHSLQLAKEPRFKPENFSGHPDQVAYYSYLIEQVKRRAHPDMVLGRVVFRDKLLPVEVAGEHFSADVLRRAQIYAAA